MKVDVLWSSMFEHNHERCLSAQFARVMKVNVHDVLNFTRAMKENVSDQ